MRRINLNAPVPDLRDVARIVWGLKHGFQSGGKELQFQAGECLSAIYKYQDFRRIPMTPGDVFDAATFHSDEAGGCERPLFARNKKSKNPTLGHGPK